MTDDFSLWVMGPAHNSPPGTAAGLEYTSARPDYSCRRVYHNCKQHGLPRLLFLSIAPSAWGIIQCVYGSCASSLRTDRDGFSRFFFYHQDSLPLLAHSSLTFPDESFTTAR